MVEPMFHKEKIMTIGNILREIRKSVNKKSQMSLRDMLVLAHCIREYIFVFATLYSRYELYSSLCVFVPALESTPIY